MIRWCSYCQEFLGESEPYTNADITHGICSECKNKGKGDREELAEVSHKAKAFFLTIQKFFEDTKSQTAQGTLEIKEFVKKAKTIGISPSSLLLGMIQPLMYEIGTLYAQGKVTIAQEHRFSQFVESLLAHIEFEYEQKNPINPQIILTCANGNFHSIGVKMLKIILSQKGISTLTFVPGIPATELESLVKKHNPSVLGISVALPSQLKEALNIAQTLEKYKLKIAIGGYITKDAVFEQYPYVDFLSNPYRFHETIEYFQNVLEKSKVA